MYKITGYRHINNLSYFYCFVDRASRYNRVKKNQIHAQLILSIFRVRQQRVI